MKELQELTKLIEEEIKNGAFPGANYAIVTPHRHNLELFVLVDRLLSVCQNSRKIYSIGYSKWKNLNLRRIGESFPMINQVLQQFVQSNILYNKRFLRMHT